MTTPAWKKRFAPRKRASDAPKSPPTKNVNRQQAVAVAIRSGRRRGI
jgi:hypothetical protein